MLARLILAYLVRVGATPATNIAPALGFDLAAVDAAILNELVPAGYVSGDGGVPVAYIATQAGADSLLTAPADSNTSAGLADSINATFAEVSTSSDATFLPDLRGAGFAGIDGRDLAYLVGEYGIGASLESGDVAILIRCSRLAQLAGALGARL